MELFKTFFFQDYMPTTHSTLRSGTSPSSSGRHLAALSGRANWHNWKPKALAWMQRRGFDEVFTENDPRNQPARAIFDENVLSEQRRRKQRDQDILN